VKSLLFTSNSENKFVQFLLYNISPVFFRKKRNKLTCYMDRRVAFICLFFFSPPPAQRIDVKSRVSRTGIYAAGAITEHSQSHSRLGRKPPEKLWKIATGNFLQFSLSVSLLCLMIRD